MPYRVTRIRPKKLGPPFLRPSTGKFGGQPPLCRADKKIFTISP